MHLTNHLKHHYKRGGRPAPSIGLLKRFTATVEQACPTSSLSDALPCYEALYNFVVDFHWHAEEIALGVFTKDSSSTSGLRLTEGLVNAFGSYVIVFTKAAQLVAFIEGHYHLRLTTGDPDSGDYDRKWKTLQDQLHDLSGKALSDIQEAYREISILCRGAPSVSSLELDEVGLPSVVAGILASVQGQVFATEGDIVSYYKACVDDLVCYILYNPSFITTNCEAATSS